jgi:hypothetical protein
MNLRYICLLALLSLLVTWGCNEVIQIQCVDENKNPINCPDENTVDEAGSTTDGNTDATATTGGDSGGDTGRDKPNPDRLNTSCQGACEWYFNLPESCQCDIHCMTNGDCCDDFEDLCSDILGSGDSGDDSGTTDGGSTTGVNSNYEFPQPYDVGSLSYKDCRGIASGNHSWCDTFDCKAIATRQKTWCSTADCRGISSGERSWCGSKDCKALADAYKCELTIKGDAEALKTCKQAARGWCDTYDCKAMTTGSVSDCKSTNCKAIVKGDYSYCFPDRDVGP